MTERSSDRSLHFDHLVFDLDDTLLDTYGSLIPQAAREACLKMIDMGLQADMTQCLSARNEIAQTNNRADMFEAIVAKFGSKNGNSSEVALSGFEAFYHRKVESNIALFRGARDMLHDLSSKYSLHLVTAGHPSTQQQKLEILKLKNTFKTITIVDTFKNETKGEAFAKLPSSRPAFRNLSIGNRLDTDIAPAKRLGWKTCWVKYGEYAKTIPRTRDEQPDFTIDSIEELIAKCQL